MFRKENIILLIMLFFLNSCGGTWDAVKRGLTNQKMKSTDEFLVKKKDPLVYPPNYDALPTPHDEVVTDESESEFEKLITNETDITTAEENSSTGSTEQNILKRIQKN